MAASVSQNGRFRAVFLSVIMVLMTQVGYTENMDFSLSFDEENELLETGGSTSNSSSNNLSPSRDNVVATVGEPMAEISWYHDVSPSGGNAGTTTQGNGSTWAVNEDKYIHSVNRDNNIATTIGDTFYYVATGGDRTNTSRIIYSYNKSTDTLGEVGTFGTMPTYSGSFSNSRALDFFANAGGILLFDGPGIDNITAYNPATDSSYSIGVSYGVNAQAGDGTGLSILVGDTLYFAGVDSTTSSVGAGLYAYTVGNNTAWLAADINPPSSDANYTVPMSSRPGYHHGFRLIGDTIYFDGAKGHRATVSSWSNEILYNETSGLELFAYNPSNHTSWQVTDIDNRVPGYNTMGQLSIQGNGLAPQCYQLNVASYAKNCNQNSMTVVGDTLFFAGQDSNSDIELWAHDTSNHSTWQVANINTLPSTEVSNFCQSTSTVGYDLDMSHIYFSSEPGGFYTIGDTVYFTATNGFYSRELWAYDTSNNSVWQVTRFYRCDDAGYSPTNNELYHFDGENNFNIVGDELFFFRDGGLYIHNDSTQYTKRLWTPNKHHRDSFTEWRTSGAVVMGDTLYGLQLYVSQPRFNYAPTDCPPNSAGGCRMQGSFLYAYDSSNETLYRTAFLPGTGYSSATGGSFHELIIDFGDTILFGGGSQYLYAHQPAEISYPKERVSEASCTISPTLPAGLNFDSNQCTISGTPTAPTSQASYTVTAVINNTTYQGNVLLETSYYPIKASVTGSDAKIGTPIDDITFRIDPTVGISSGSGGNSESSGSDSSNVVVCGVISNSYHTCEGTVRNWYGSDYRSDYGTGLSFDWSSHVFGEAVATNPSFPERNPIDSAVDSNGHVHIVVIADGSGSSYLDTLTYVTNQSGSWQSFVIDDVSSQTMTSIAIDSNDSVHIAYGGYNTSTNIGSLKHATNENGSWVLSIISTAHPHTASSIAIDSQDNPHIAFVENRKYQTYDQGSAHIATNTNGSWTVSTVYTNSTYASASSDDYDSGRHAVLAIDSNDSLHLSWGVEIDGEMVIHYSSNQSGNWSDAVVDRYDSNADLITDSILVDSNDNVHLLHHKSQRYNVFEYTGAITHYTQENGTWTNSTAYHLKCAHGSTSRPADDCEIEAVIDSNDVIHIAYEVGEINTATQHSSALTKVQYSNNANGYFSPGVDVYPARNVAEMHVHSNGDVDFIYLLENHPNQWAGDKLILTSMNNSELNPSYPMYENNKIATGYNHSCGIIHDNSLVCWGSDYYGQLGDGGTNTDRPYVATYLPVDLGTDRTALAVAAGHSHTCAILDDGSLKCWGDNSHGQLGDGSTTDRTSPVQVDLGAGNTAVAISAGHSHTCAILQDGTLKCWGQDNKGQVGDGGTNSDQSSPVTINLGSGRTADSVSTGVHHTCAVLDDGSIKCWGLNNEGQLGDGSTTNSGTPVSVNLDAGKTAYAVAAGLHHTCAIVDDHVECWGNNDHYQLKGGYWGNPVYQGQDHSSTEPVVTAKYYDNHMGKLRAISAGYNHTCLVTDDAMNCWGNRTDSTSSYQYLPCARYDCWHEAPWIDEDIGLENETHIAVSSYGNRHCTITSVGKVVCRGYFAEDSNLEYDYYMTGSGSHSPYQFWYVDNLDAVNVYQWNNTAEAGSATSPNMVSYDDVKYKFSGGGSTTAGQMHTTSSQTMCLVHSTDIHNVASRDFRDPFYYSFYGSDIDQWNHRDGSLVCRGTGYHFGQSELHSRSTSHFVSMDIPEERTVEYISPGNTCAILDDGSLMCWGYNYHGQVGDGSNYSNSGAHYKYSPVYVDLGEGRTAVAVDNNPTSHSCAILDNGAVKCWGRNDDGQLGDGSTTNSATPVSVSLPAGRTAVALASGQSHNCVILDNASVMCWGDGYGGALGNANSAVQTTPVYVDLGTNRIPVKISSYSSSGSSGTTCVVFDDGSLTCWGGQSYGQTLTLPENYTLPAGRTAFDVAIGEESNAEYVYVHLDDNRVCRKTSYNGDCNYVGYSHLPKSGSSFPYESTDLTAVAISAGDGGLCAVLVNGMLRCTDGQYSYGTYGLLHTYD
ncbi:MAG: putative Ig domain-containing protein, partial [Candidatus Poseidoniaceae archaeon]